MLALAMSGLWLACQPELAEASSLRFFGNGTGDIDRAKIRIDDPTDDEPGPPADVGATDFTIEFWLRAATGNDAPAVTCGANNAWINGNIVFDRDRYNQAPAFGISLAAGRVVFGMRIATDRTLCGTTDIRDGAWHHVAVQRRRADGFMWLFVDGDLEAAASGPAGDASYPDDGVPGNFCGGPCNFSDPFIVLGAEKHDAGPQFPSFRGWLDELRLSTVLRYPPDGGAFTPAQQPFAPDPQTAALYHFDAGSGTIVEDSSGAAGGPSHGALSIGGNPIGPSWDLDTPFSASAASTIEFAEASATIDESAGMAILHVARSGSLGAVSIDYRTADGTAEAPSDYAVTMGTLSWSHEDATQRLITVPIVDDAESEADETFFLMLVNPLGDAVLGGRASAIVSIRDDDAPAVPGAIQFTSAILQVQESSAAAYLEVARVDGVLGDVTVDYVSEDGTATGNADYLPVAGTLTWVDGDAGTRSIAIPLIDDPHPESRESFVVRVTNPTGGATLGSPDRATVAILASDGGLPTSGGGGGGVAGPASTLALLAMWAWGRRRMGPDRSRVVG